MFIHCEYVTMQGAKQVTVRRPQATVLFDGTTGELEGMIIGPLAGERVDLRTAATSALGTRLMARPDAEVLGLFGAGKQATGHLRAFCLAMPQLHEIRVYSPTEERRLAFADRMSGELGRPVRAVEHPREVVDRADVILGATNTNVPLFDGAWLAPGQHVTSIAGSNAGLVRSGLLDHKRRELDDDTLQRAERIVLVSRQQAIQDEQGEIFDPVQRGVVTWDKVVELRDVIAGTGQGRVHSREITVFMNNAGQGGRGRGDRWEGS